MEKWLFLIDLNKLKIDKDYFNLTVLVHILAFYIPLSKIKFYQWNLKDPSIIPDFVLLVMMVISLGIVLNKRFNNSK